MVDPALFSSTTDKWATPPELLAYLEKKYGHEYGEKLFDPCPLEWKPGDPDGLAIPWGERTFCNPPYSKIGEWARKAREEAEEGKVILFLCPARTDTKYFHEHLMRAEELLFIEGRLRFGGSKNTAPFPSMIAHFTPWGPLRYSGIWLTTPIARRLTRAEIRGETETGSIYTEG